ncbi:hypothetical protein C2S52_000696 [Perilla frutescens var. hirtella]|nr:hypothetical protein C2S52_000696 [Perilla frutescens var. hirtella]
MAKSDFDANAIVLQKYVHGQLPRERGVAWKEVDNIYGVAHILKSHWVAYEINLDDETITVYDSLSRGYDWNPMKKYTENMSRFLPWLCKTNGVFTASSKTEWDVISCQNSPQQANCHDCGVMALTYIKCLVSNTPMCMIKPRNGPIIHERSCAELFHCSEVVGGLASRSRNEGEPN